MKDFIDSKVRYLIHAYLEGDASDTECEALREAIRKDPAVVDALLEKTMENEALVSVLQRMAEEEAAASAVGRAPLDSAGKTVFRLRWFAALAASLLVGVGVWMWSREGQVSSRLRPEASARQGVKGEVVAKVEKASGECRISNVEYRNLKVGEEVRTGDRIETGKDGAVTLAWVKEPTTVQLDGNSSLDTRHSTLSFLQRGRLSAVVAKQEPGKPLVIETPHARATVKGTKFGVRVDEKATRLAVDEGLMRFTRLADGETIEVAAGEFSVAGASAADFALKPHRSGTKYVDGQVVFREDFSKGLGDWRIYMRHKDTEIFDVEDGAENTAERVDARFRDKKADIRVVDIPGGSGKCVRLRLDASSQYPLVRLTKKSMLLNDESYSVEADYTMEGKSGEAVAGGFGVFIEKPASDKWAWVARGPALQQQRPGQWIHTRAEVTIYNDASGRRCVEVAKFYNGQLQSRRGCVDGDLKELNIDAVVEQRTSLLVKDVVIRKMERVGE